MASAVSILRDDFDDMTRAIEAGQAKSGQDWIRQRLELARKYEDAESDGLRPTTQKPRESISPTALGKRSVGRPSTIAEPGEKRKQVSFLVSGTDYELVQAFASAHDFKSVAAAARFLMLNALGHSEGSIGTPKQTDPIATGDPVRACENPDFKKYALANQWKTRRDRGLPWRMDVFEFVHNTYGRWIEHYADTPQPLTQADIKAVDQPLWQKFQQEIYKRGAPDWLKLPTEKSATLDAVVDPEQRELRERMRALESERSKLRRRLKK